MIAAESPFPPQRAFVAVCLSWFLSQLAKVIRGLAQRQRFNVRWLFDTGGMPSSHSASVASLSTAVGLYYGFGSVIFLAVLIFSIITMFDAANVRRNMGRQAVALNRMIDEFYEKGSFPERRLKEFLGHTPFEVLAGALLGVVVTLALCAF